MDSVGVSYRVSCSAGGVGGVGMNIRLQGLHVVLRCGASTNTLMWFCPACRREHWSQLSNAETRRLVEAGVGFEVLQVPGEALETHLPTPVTEGWVEAQVVKLRHPQWRPPLG